MITEDYISFETAKLLKEKGFNWEESPFYSEQDRDEWRQNNSYSVPNEEYKPDIPFDTETLTKTAPHISLQMAMKWLREEKNIIINVWYNGVDWDAEYYNNEDENFYFITIDSSCNSYEEAVEEGIKYCLEKLI